MKKDSFEEIRVLDNFYQTSSFYPMPVVLVSTVAETGQTNLGPYSLVFPYVIAGEHAMMLISRSSSNTAQNIRRTGKATLNFVPDGKKFMRSCVELGFPGETTEEKMKRSVFSLINSIGKESDDEEEVRPQIVQEAIQVFECTWDDSYTYQPSEMESHFLLRIDRILMQESWKKCLVSGKGFPRLPVDYGYRDNTNFWISRHTRPVAYGVPKGRGTNVESIIYQAGRLDPDIVWEKEACAKLTNVPRVFLKTVMQSANEEAKKRGESLITPALLDEIRDKRAQEKTR
jgi:flavin reductase (DIM6/NTAB) family NADH-FMN oxidoreductase RutF